MTWFHQRELYFKYRQSADIISSHLLDVAILNRNHIIWETTGTTIQKSILKMDLIKRFGYTVLLAFPFVHEEQIIERIKNRAKEEGRKPFDTKVKRSIRESHANFPLLLPYVDEAYIFDNTGKKGFLSLAFSYSRSFGHRNTRTGVIEHIKCAKAIEKWSGSDLYKNFLNETCKRGESF